MTNMIPLDPNAPNASRHMHNVSLPMHLCVNLVLWSVASAFLFLTPFMFMDLGPDLAKGAPVMVGVAVVFAVVAGLLGGLFTFLVHRGAWVLMHAVEPLRNKYREGKTEGEAEALDAYYAQVAAQPLPQYAGAGAPAYAAPFGSNGYGARFSEFPVATPAPGQFEDSYPMAQPMEEDGAFVATDTGAYDPWNGRNPYGCCEDNYNADGLLTHGGPGCQHPAAQ